METVAEGRFVDFVALEYHRRTEEFDQAHCAARDRNGIARPMGAEGGLCTRNAHDVRRHLAALYGVEAVALEAAIRRTMRVFEERWAVGDKPEPLPVPPILETQ